MSRLRAPWQNGPYKNNTQNNTKTRRTPWRNIHLEKTIVLCFSQNKTMHLSIKQYFVRQFINNEVRIIKSEHLIHTCIIGHLLDVQSIDFKMFKLQFSSLDNTWKHCHGLHRVRGYQYSTLIRLWITSVL